MVLALDPELLVLNDPASMLDVGLIGIVGALIFLGVRAINGAGGLNESRESSIYVMIVLSMTVILSLESAAIFIGVFNVFNA